jgi:ABC-type branched-subunit amino acid transport system permease subunit
MDYFLHILILIGIYAIFAMSLNVQVGVTGLFNFGHVAFFGIGAYTSALLTLRGIPFEIGLLSGACAAGLSGFLLGIPALRLRGDYFAITTLGFGEIIRLIAKNEVWLTRGPMGLPGIRKPTLLFIHFNTLPRILVLTAMGVVVTYLILEKILRTPFGRVLIGIREDEYAAMAMGKDIFAFKVRVLVIGSIFAGVAGVLWAHYITFISPYDFTLSQTIMVWLMVVLGGKGNNIGAVLGAAVLVTLQGIISFLPVPANVAHLLGAVQQLIFGAALYSLMLFRPQGLLGR